MTQTTESNSTSSIGIRKLAIELLQSGFSKEKIWETAQSHSWNITKEELFALIDELSPEDVVAETPEANFQRVKIDSNIFQLLKGKKENASELFKQKEELQEQLRTTENHYRQVQSELQKIDNEFMGVVQTVFTIQGIDAKNKQFKIDFQSKEILIEK